MLFFKNLNRRLFTKLDILLHANRCKDHLSNSPELPTGINCPEVTQ